MTQSERNVALITLLNSRQLPNIDDDGAAAVVETSRSMSAVRGLTEFNRDLDEYVTATRGGESEQDPASPTERQNGDHGYKV